jgi:hypothetical protein
VYRRGTPSIFAQACFELPYIGLRVGQMPEPQPDEPQAAFLERWRRAYLGELREFFRLGPENLRLAGGIWRNIATADTEA